MPILLKKIDGSVLSYYGPLTSDLSGEIIFIKSIVGELGVEDYINITGVEGFVQDFSSVVVGVFCTNPPTNIGSIACPSFTNLNLSF